MKKYRPYIFIVFINLILSIFVVYLSPRFDILTLFGLLLVNIFVLFLIIKVDRKNQKIREEKIDQIFSLLHNLDLDYPSYEIIDDEFGKLRDEIAKIVLENKKITKDAEKNSQILTDYTEDIAHQIKTPLTGILLMLDLLEEDKENQDLYIKKIRENLSRLKELSDLLLKLASLDSGQINMKKDQVDIKKLLEDLIDEMEIYFSSDDFALSISGEDFILTCDKRWTYEAAFNLVKNALEASEKKKVDILLKETNIYKSILVIDYSQGMDKKMLEKVFKRFYKANPKSKGYGIGLPMAKSIMEKQNGDLIYVKGKKSNSFEMRFYK